MFKLYILQIKLAFVQKEVRDCTTHKKVSSERSWMHHIGEELVASVLSSERNPPAQP